MGKYTLIKRSLAACVCAAALLGLLGSDGYSTMEFVGSSSGYGYAYEHKKCSSWSYNPYDNEYTTTINVAKTQGVESDIELTPCQRSKIAQTIGVDLNTTLDIRETITLDVPPFKGVRSTFTPYMQIVSGQLMTTTRVGGIVRTSGQNVTIYIPVADENGNAIGAFGRDVA